MGILDIGIGIFLVWGLWKGFRNGLVIELASIIAVVVGIYGAMRFSYFAGDYMREQLAWDGQYVAVIAFIVTFLAFAMAIHLAGKLLTKFADFALMGTLNKLAGAFFGTLKFAVILGALLVFLDRTGLSAKLISQDTIASSKLYTPVRDLGGMVFSAVLNPSQKTQEEQQPRPETISI